MSRLIMYLIALLLPWLTLLIYDNPGGALVAIIMQATVIGWPFASVWAFKVVKEHKKSHTKGP